MKHIKRLICACCGASAMGRQWWNRDTGFGLCKKCADWIPAKYNMDAEGMRLSYGVRGVHYDCAEEVS
jgi:hypothetical protein